MTYALIRSPVCFALSSWSAGDGGLNWQMREERREIFERRAGRAVSVLNCYHSPSRCCGNWLPASPLISSVFTVTLVRWGEVRGGEVRLPWYQWCARCAGGWWLCAQLSPAWLGPLAGPGESQAMPGMGTQLVTTHYTLHYSTTDNTSTTY